MNIVEYRICYRKISLLKLWKKMEINGGKGDLEGPRKALFTSHGTLPSMDKLEHVWIFKS